MTSEKILKIIFIVAPTYFILSFICIIIVWFGAVEKCGGWGCGLCEKIRDFSNYLDFDVE